MGSTFRHLTPDEALCLNRWQLFARAIEEQQHWDRHRNGRRLPAAGAVYAALEFRMLCHTHLGVSPDADDFAAELATARTRADAASLYSRIDGSPPRRPQRVQLSRRAGFRLPYGTKVVSRPSRFGNPFVVGVDGNGNRGDVVWRFRAHLERRRTHPVLDQIWAYPSDDEIRTELAGWDLACWCPLTNDSDSGDDHCHADVLLRFANDRYWPDSW